MKYKLSKPNLEKVNTEKIYKLLSLPNIIEYLESSLNPQYLYWDKIKYKKRPHELSPEEFWSLIKLSRSISINSEKTPVRDDKGNYFHWLQLNRHVEFLNLFDSIAKKEQRDYYSLSDFEKKMIIKNGLIEEAISSSQIEGANTTRRAAKKMILEGLKPNNTSEHMIFNNYKTITSIESGLQNRNLDDSLMHLLHSLLTEKTLDKKDIGRYRVDLDQIVVSSVTDETIYHIPPSQEILQNEIKNLFIYANDNNKNSNFIHPLIKAIIIHFWIGYLHPYVDGNGRLARALFYWYLMKHDFKLIGCFPLSSMIKKSRGQYRDAYLYTQQDENDLTYFIDYNINKLELSLKEFTKYIDQIKAESHERVKLALKNINLNQRQLQLLKHFRKHMHDTVTIKSCSNHYSITRMTARKDLLKLKELGFLTSKKIGKFVHYFATEKVNELFEK